jgi:hypothetical protein
MCDAGERYVTGSKSRDERVDERFARRLCRLAHLRVRGWALLRFVRPVVRVDDRLSPRNAIVTAPRDVQAGIKNPLL